LGYPEKLCLNNQPTNQPKKTKQTATRQILSKKTKPKPKRDKTITTKTSTDRERDL
jgi:hypothetical protein